MTTPTEGARFPTALVMHPDCALHDTGWGHPEHQGRLPGLLSAIVKDTPTLQGVMLQQEAAPAAEADLLRVHTPELVGRIRAAAASAAESAEPVRIETDTVVSAASWDAALGAAGSAIAAARLVADGRAATAFALTRPPGHHANADEAMGFCLFNNVAVAARWLQAERGVGRVLIVDWDVHHGNGTQDIFWSDASVYFLSLHLAEHYPGSGGRAERGAGPGAGTTRNVPLPQGTPAADYLRTFADELDSALAEFQPEFVLVSAGFDALAGDPLGGLLLEPGDVHTLMRILLDRAQAICGGRIAVVLEGGYVPKRLGAGSVQLVRALAGLPPAS